MPAPLLDLRPLKQEALERRTPGDPLREALLAEPDRVDRVAFAAKVRPWLALLRLGRSGDGPDG